MAKKKKASVKRKESTQEQNVEHKLQKVDLFGEEKFTKVTKTIITIVVLWIFTMVVFHKLVGGYVTNEWNHFNLSGDNLAAAAIDSMGVSFQKEGKVPNWCPYIFCGMPMVGGLLYVNHYNPVFYPFLRYKILSWLYWGSNFGWLFFFYTFLGGLGVYYLLRHLKVNWIFALLCAILFSFNQTMVVFADVGHGLKVMTISFLPWLLYFTIRIFEERKFKWVALLSISFGWQLTAHHIQIAYYGVMMMGLYALYNIFVGGKSGIKNNIKATLLVVLSGLLGLSIAAPVYLQVLEYSPHILREAGAFKSAAWDYATQWSFHPLESLTYILPSFFGFGRETYWGHMPFTDMPLYWGGLVLLFAPWAVVLKRDRLTWFLVVLAAAAWIVSFGRFLPILYWPFYELLPYFNKFRVPSLIQVLVLLPAVLLAGRGLQGIFERIGNADEKAMALGQRMLRIGVIIAVSCVVLLILQAALRQSWTGWILSRQPRLQVQGAQAALSLLSGDIVRLLILGSFTYISMYLIFVKKYTYLLLCFPIILYIIFETMTFDNRLIRPVTPVRAKENYLKQDDVVQFLKKDDTPFRIYPISGTHHPDWYMPHRIESIHGYSATKMKIYQEAVDSIGLNNTNLLKLMNVRYFISDRPISHPDLEEVFVGQRERVYRYKQELPRAFLVNRAVQVASESDVLNLYRQGTFDFSQAAVLEEPLSSPLDQDATGSVAWVSRAPDQMILDVETSGRQLLFLSEVYYPSGWKATVDGADIPILKCNFMFRGVEVPAGNHRIELSFAPKSLSRGKWLNRIAWIIILIGLASSFLLRKRRAADRPEV